jgi:hypothetical protein
VKLSNGITIPAPKAASEITASRRLQPRWRRASSADAQIALWLLVPTATSQRSVGAESPIDRCCGEFELLQVVAVL